MRTSRLFDTPVRICVFSLNFIYSGGKNTLIFVYRYGPIDVWSIPEVKNYKWHHLEKIGPWSDEDWPSSSKICWKYFENFKIFILLKVLYAIMTVMDTLKD